MQDEMFHLSWKSPLVKRAWGLNTRPNFIIDLGGLVYEIIGRSSTWPLYVRN